MKLYLKNGNVFKINEEVSVEFLNLDDFISNVKSHSKNVPAGHFIEVLKYKLIDGDKSYLGETECDSYNGFTSQMDESSSYDVKVTNFGHLEEIEEAFIEIEINKR